MWMEGPCSMMVVEEDEGLRATWDQHAAETSLATKCQPVSDEWVNGGGGVVVVVLAEQTGHSPVTLPGRRPATSIHTNLNKG